MNFQEQLGFHGFLLSVLTWKGTRFLRNFLREHDFFRKSAGSAQNFLQVFPDLKDQLHVYSLLSGNNSVEGDVDSILSRVTLDELGFDELANMVVLFGRTVDGQVDPSWWTVDDDLSCNCESALAVRVRCLIQLYADLSSSIDTRLTLDEFEVKWSSLVCALLGEEDHEDAVFEYGVLKKRALMIENGEDYLELICNLSNEDEDVEDELNEDLNEDTLPGSDEVDAKAKGEADESVELNVINAKHYYPEDASNPDLPQLGELACVKLLGEGGFGKVWLFKDKVNLEPVAVKQGSCSFSKKVLANEIGVMRKLKNERIVRYYGARVMHGRFSLLMEYVSNGSVRDKIKSDGPFTEELTIKLTKQILEGVAYLHKQLIIHRDIKGANVLLTEKEDVKLTDFGLAWRLSKEGDLASGRAGTLSFLAPEIARGEPYGTKADIWSIGCTVLEMINGDPPLANCPRSTEEVIYAIANMLPIYTLPLDVTQKFRVFLQRIFVLRPMSRPAAKHLLLDILFE